MNIITKKVRLIPAPFVGTRIKIVLDDPESLTWGMHDLSLADGHEKVIIDWGDGIREAISDPSLLQHTYNRTGEYEVRISDDISEIRCSGGPTSPYFTTYAPMIRSCITNATALTTIGGRCFLNAANMGAFICKGSGVTEIASFSFRDCPSLKGRLDLWGIDTVMSNAFTSSAGITELHFSEANKEKIMALDGYDTAFSAPNATVWCDL